MAKTGKRVQIYIPADLLDRWKALPRYERSATVAAALRKLWKLTEDEQEKKSDVK